MHNNNNNKGRDHTAKSHWNKHINTDHIYPCPHCQRKFAHGRNMMSIYKVHIVYEGQVWNRIVIQLN